MSIVDCLAYATYAASINSSGTNAFVNEKAVFHLSPLEAGRSKYPIKCRR
jgi:hypothetical protein